MERNDIDTHYPSMTAQRNAQIEPRPVVISDPVIYSDPKGVEHNAIVTAVWGAFTDHPLYTQEDVDHLIADTKAKWPQYDNSAIYQDLLGRPIPVPCINLVYVELDETKTDSYGRQIARNTSVPHQSMTQAHGMFWRNS